MKQLTLALLLSIAPAAINACDTNRCGTNCDRTTQQQTDDERCCDLAELALIDATQARDATGATITASNQNMSVEGWDFVTELLTATFGTTPATQTTDSISFEFARGNMDTFEWFETLAALEAKFIEAQSTITNNPNCVDTLEFSLSN